jgi:hypothetical protein
MGPIMVLVASITNKKKRKENTKKEREGERESYSELPIINWTLTGRLATCVWGTR